MIKLKRSNVVNFTAGALPEVPRKKSSTEKIWGKSVVRHGYAGIPSLLIRNQKALKITATQMNIIVQLLEYWFEETRPPFPTKQQLSERSGINPKTIQINMRILEALGYIKREPQRTAAGDWGGNIYHLDGLVAAVQKIEAKLAAEKKKESAGRPARKVRRQKAVTTEKSRRSSSG